MIALKEIVSSINYTKIIGNIEIDIEGPVQANSESHSEKSITWVSDKNLNLLERVDKGAVVCSMEVKTFKRSVTYILVENPRLVFSEIISKFFEIKAPVFISKFASIHQSARIGIGVTIDHFVVIEENCVVGDGSVVGSHTVLKRNTIVGDNVKIGSNNTIGSVGFGYERDETGAYILIPHLGNVVLEDFVEIGNNTCIDRAVLGSTIIRQNSKIDNLVHIAHGVVIGKNSLVIANAMIGGSAIIGENVWVAPSVSILNKRTIHDNAFIGMSAVVIKDVESGDVIVGNPGRPISSRDKA